MIFRVGIIVGIRAAVPLGAKQDAFFTFVDVYKRQVSISDCEPDISAVESLLVDKAKKVMVKLSPMLDMSLALNELKTVRSVDVYKRQVFMVS